MAEVSKISIDNKPVGSVRLAIRHGLLWGYLIGAEAASHYFFGGSWVIDVMVLALMGLLITTQAMKSSGAAVHMTREEIRQWVDSGMPNNVKQWRALRELAKTAS